MASHQLVLRQVRVPDVERAHLGELGHRLPVGRHRRERRGAGIGLGEAVVARRDREARRHALHVVLERPGQRLVEVVQVEQQRPLGRREHAEVREMRVAAELDLETRRRRVLQVGGHDLRRAAVERERRDHHPPVADRHEIGLAGGVLLLEQRDRVGPARSWLSIRRAPTVRPARARCLADSHSILHGWMHDRCS